MPRILKRTDILSTSIKRITTLKLWLNMKRIKQFHPRPQYCASCNFTFNLLPLAIIFIMTPPFFIISQYGFTHSFITNTSHIAKRFLYSRLYPTIKRIHLENFFQHINNINRRNIDFNITWPTISMFYYRRFC